MKGVRNLRIGAIGARPAAFNTVRYSEKILEHNGISVETLDLSEVMGRIGRMKDDDPTAVGKLNSIQKYVSTSGIPQQALLKMAKLGAVVDSWMKAADVQISAVQCWTSLEENLGVWPCTIMSMMSLIVAFERLRSRRGRRVGDACFGARIGNAECAAGLE